MKTQLTILTALVAFSVGTATAGDVTGLTTFSSGTTARASEVNGNFTAVKTAVDDNQTQIMALQALVAALTTRLETLENSTVQKLDGTLDLNGNTAVFTGVNVQVVNGANTTGSNNGLGNLIVGYDAPSDNPMTPPSVKSGSHNVVIGNFHSYTSYGGLVAGYENTVSGRYSSVTGGERNTASGPRTSVSGGFINAAVADYSSVSGGANNTASGPYSSVSGGGHATNPMWGNIAVAELASVSGGQFNRASGRAASVSGGFNNRADGIFSSVSGGDAGLAEGDNSSISGGQGGIASGITSSISGGVDCRVTTIWSWTARDYPDAQIDCL